MATPLDIIAIGCVAMDYYLLLDALPWQDEKVKAQSAYFLPGGTMGNFACASAKLGAKAGFVGIVGDDLWGDLLMNDFKELGIDTSRIIKRKDQPTPLTILILDKQGKRTNILPPFPSIRLEDIDIEYLIDTKILHTHLFDGEVFKHFATKVKGKNIIISIDLELQRVKQISSHELKVILSLCDLVFLNQETLAWIVPFRDIEAAAHSLREEGPQSVIVTLGEKGSLVVTSYESIRMTPFKMRTVDATGAGDSFAGAFCFGWLQGWPLKKTMEFASAASALAVTKIGARAGLPTSEQVLSFLKTAHRSLNGYSIKR